MVVPRSSGDPAGVFGRGDLRIRLRLMGNQPISRQTHLLLHYGFCLLLILALLVIPSVSSGQTDSLPIEEWAATANRAVSVLEDPDATTDQLETLRSDLSDQRGLALEAQDALKARVETLEAELASLEAPPEDGTAEAPEIARERNSLSEAISEAKVPLLRAQAAYERADGLIGEIDGVVRGRLSAELTSLGPSPVNPVHWPNAASEIAGTGDSIVGGYREALGDPSTRGQLLGKVPFAVVLILLGLVVQLYAKPRTVGHLSQKFNDAVDNRWRQIWRYLLTLVRNLLPAIAALAFILGIDQLDPRPAGATSLTVALVPMAFVLIAAYWLGNALFSPDNPELAIIKVDLRAARAGRRNALLVALILTMMILVRFVATQAGLSEPTRAILMLPLFLLGGLFLARLSLAIRSRAETTREDEEEGASASAPATTIIRDALSRAGFVIALVVPVLAIVGYLPAATALFAPTVYTFGLLGGLVAVYTTFRDAIDGWLDGNGDAASKTYRKRFRSVPVIGGFVLTCLAVPLLALVWGARVSELQEVWIWLRDGVTIGDVRLSVTDALAFILVFAIGYTITRMVQAVIRGSVLPRMDMDRGAANAIVSGIGYVGIFLSAVIAISATGLSLGNLAIVAGALSVGIGFGLQTIVSNFVSGIILLVERPIKEGDWIEVAGFSGYVRKISVRSTLIDTFDKASVIVPNSELIAGSVLNWTHSEMTGRVIVPVGVAYGEDPRKVEEILMGIAQAHPMVLRRPAPAVIFMGFGADSMDFEIRAFLRDVNWMLTAKSEMNFSIVKRFEEEGIEIPYAQRDINIRNVDQAAKAFWHGQKETKS